MKRLLHIQAEILGLKENLKYAKRQQHNYLYKEYKSLFIFMDILVVLMMLMNFGALFTTNLLVSQKNYENSKITGEPVTYIEANAGGFAAKELETIEDIGLTSKELIESKKKVSAEIRLFLLFALYWIVILAMYMISRIKCYSHLHLTIMVVVILWYFTLLSMDFVNDFGFYIGKVLFS